MKLIISGGRKYKFTQEDIELLDSIKHTITEIVTGGATGADSEGVLWAVANDIPVKQFPADWARLGKKAGVVRNKEMAVYGDAVLLFTGGRGTMNMYNCAIKEGITVMDYRVVGG
jgi:hypothetical protein